MLKKNMRLLGAKKKLANIVQVEKEEQEVENLVKKCNYKNRISYTSNCLIIPFSEPIYPPLNSPAVFLVQTTSANY